MNKSRAKRQKRGRSEQKEVTRERGDKRGGTKEVEKCHLFEGVTIQRSDKNMEVQTNDAVKRINLNLNEIIVGSKNFRA